MKYFKTQNDSIGTAKTTTKSECSLKKIKEQEIKIKTQNNSQKFLRPLKQIYVSPLNANSALYKPKKKTWKYIVSIYYSYSSVFKNGTIFKMKDIKIEKKRISSSPNMFSLFKDDLRAI